MGFRTAFRQRHFSKGKALLSELLPGRSVPNPLSVDYLLLVVEYRKREYLLAVEKVAATKWYSIPRAALDVWRAYGTYRRAASLLACEIARSAPSFHRP